MWHLFLPRNIETHRLLPAGWLACGAVCGAHQGWLLLPEAVAAGRLPEQVGVPPLASRPYHWFSTDA
jgi:hypothetical protein